MEELNKDQTTKKVVIIEDREEDIALMKRVIAKDFPYIEILSITDADELLRMLENGELLRHRPDLMFIDIKMPKISGIEVLEIMEKKQEFDRVPKVMLSSSTHPNDLISAYKHKANSYLVKPSSYSNLKDVLKETLHYWLHLNLN
ncbi:response regulator [Nonlabens ponticola]|uniref:Response regulator n=1 Tax=Nonlabens ponticola TaxID=2496866 RepID=A0A3S9MVM7_9FLAO|nr:response regulator [Nonlabens ponticola]AZQ43258.1 response regulator [Nonlabens ponticola]